MSIEVDVRKNQPSCAFFRLNESSPKISKAESRDYRTSENTWEPKAHMPTEMIEAFENPDHDPVRVQEARERIGLEFERGLKVPLQYEVKCEELNFRKSYGICHISFENCT